MWSAEQEKENKKKDDVSGSTEHLDSCVCVCVCVVIPFILDVRFVGVAAGVTGGGSSRISSPFFCGSYLIFLARRIQPFLSLVDRIVVLDYKSTQSSFCFTAVTIMYPT